MDAFAEYSLATIAVEASSVGVTSMLNLHDLLRDLIRKRREQKLRGLHLRLVEAWDALPKLPDAYAWRWIAYHVVEAGRKEDLHRLLLDFDYLQAKLAATDANALIADYDCIAGEEGLRLIKGAIRLSANALARGHRQLASQLTGRLLDIDDNDIQALLKQTAEKAPRPSLWPLRGNLTPPGGPLIRILEGHSIWVSGVTITPEGRRAVSASWDNTLRVWDLKNGQSLRTLEGHTDLVWTMAITPDGHRAVSGSEDQTLRVWDLESGQTLRMLEGHSDSVTGVAITTDGRRAVSASWDNTLRVWDLESGQSLRALQGHSRSVAGVAITTDGRRAISASDDNTLRVWDLESGKELALLTADDHTFSCEVSFDGRTIVAGDATGRVHFLHLVEADETKPSIGETKIQLLHRK